MQWPEGTGIPTGLHGLIPWRRAFRLLELRFVKTRGFLSN